MGLHGRTRERIGALVDTLGPGPWPLSALTGLGWTEEHVRRAVAAGALVRLRRGVYRLAPGHPVIPRGGDIDTSGSGAPPAGAGRLPDRVQAALLAAPAPAWLCHLTAGETEGIWLPRDRDRLVHLAIPGVHDDVVNGVRTHGSELPVRFVTMKDGVPVTTTARTAVDIARYRGLPDALMVLDSAARIIGGARSTRDLRHPGRRALAQELAMDQLREAYGFERRWPGARSVRYALDYVDVASESPHESWSRGWIIASRIALPEAAVPLVGASGREWWVDFVWRRQRIIGEADGFGKYGSTDAEVRRALIAQRERQLDLEAAGWRFVRWDTAENPEGWTRRLLSAVGPRT